MVGLHLGPQSPHFWLGPLFWGRHSDQGEEGSPAGGGTAREGEDLEALGLPGHPSLCESECGQERPKPLCRSTQEVHTCTLALPQ